MAEFRTEVADDAFGRFVTALSELLDEPDATDRDLADRLYMSRFHFARVIARIAGEPPTAFRRRVLLERAAYRLLTTQNTVLEIAIEAGYSSHEAFTRAFGRAYGASPAHWRSSPGQIQIDAPSHVHFHPPRGLRLPAKNKVTSMDLVRNMIDHHVWLLGEMLTRAERLTDEQLDAPIRLSISSVDDNPSLRSLLSRLVGQLDMWNATIEGRPYDFAVEDRESVASMRNRLTEVGPAFAARIDEICDQGRLDEMLVCCAGDGDSEIFTYGAVVAHVLTFAAHRRTLVACALEDVGFDDLDTGDPIRWISRAA